MRRPHPHPLPAYVSSSGSSCIGAEVYGVSPEVISWLDATVEIPQVGHVRSLNVHVSSSLAIFEHAKQNRLRLSG